QRGSRCAVQEPEWRWPRPQQPRRPCASSSWRRPQGRHGGRAKQPPPPPADSRRAADSGGHSAPQGARGADYLPVAAGIAAPRAVSGGVSVCAQSARGPHACPATVPGYAATAHGVCRVVADGSSAAGHWRRARHARPGRQQQPRSRHQAVGDLWRCVWDNGWHDVHGLAQWHAAHCSHLRQVGQRRVLVLCAGRGCHAVCQHCAKV
ncbi:hypothetical protein H4218_006343, partial [Coemansia sp. IMI 209128]